MWWQWLGCADVQPVVRWAGWNSPLQRRQVLVLSCFIQPPPQSLQLPSAEHRLMEEFAAFKIECCQNLLEETSTRRGERVIVSLLCSLICWGRRAKGKRGKAVGTAPLVWFCKINQDFQEQAGHSSPRWAEMVNSVLFRLIFVMPRSPDSCFFKKWEQPHLCLSLTWYSDTVLQGMVFIWDFQCLQASLEVQLKGWNIENSALSGPEKLAVPRKGMTQSKPTWGALPVSQGPTG